VRRARVGILISGRGSNMSALIAAAKRADYPAEIVCVIANRPNAGGVGIAAGEGVPSQVIDHKAFDSKADFEAALAAALDAHGVEIIALAGFMRVLSADFIARYPGRILNIHPSLLPAFKGLDTHERALAAGVKEHGCSVHIVNAELDDGPVLMQASVPVLEGDTPGRLAARVLEAEHRIYPSALAQFAARLLAS
jgi:phosphoribosylglycinamide formyltransferase 1